MEKEEKSVVQENSTKEQSMEAKRPLKRKLRYYSGEIQRDVGNLVKWLMLAVLMPRREERAVILTSINIMRY